MKKKSYTPPNKVSPFNTSGIIGVSLHVRRYITAIGTTTKHCYWQANYHYEGKEHNTRYSVTKYGNKEAFKMACQIRYEHCGTLIIYSPKLLPCLPDVPFEVQKK